ncbi:MAG: LapA family protein [Gammaproteobacteria bacterium]|nr:LapA family protein [Gammaproteobacteria bacterium]
MNKMTIKLIVATALIVLVMIFAVQNAAVVDIRLLFWDVALPRSLLIFMMLLIGVVIGWFLRSVFRILKK